MRKIIILVILLVTYSSCTVHFIWQNPDAASGNKISVEGGQSGSDLLLAMLHQDRRFQFVSNKRVSNFHIFVGQKGANISCRVIDKKGEVVMIKTSLSAKKFEEEIKFFLDDLATIAKGF